MYFLNCALNDKDFESKWKYNLFRTIDTDNLNKVIGTGSYSDIPVNVIISHKSDAGQLLPVDNVVNEFKSPVDEAIYYLNNHPIHSMNTSDMTLQNLVVRLGSNNDCKINDIPLFISMASIGSIGSLYWELVENFIYAMIKFKLINCALLICVSDKKCFDACKKYKFPCYFYEYDMSTHKKNKLPSTMEQIATLKLYDLPKVLLEGINTFIIDLDVGFHASPMLLLKQLEQEVDVYVQKDITFVMNRTKIGWKTWWTEDMPNIGLMLTKGNKRTHEMFQLAWMDYLNANGNIKQNPGKDQNKVVSAMRTCAYRNGLKWDYFNGTVLIDKVYKFKTKNIELGGDITESILNNEKITTKMNDNDKRYYDNIYLSLPNITVATHTTCYEQRSKIHGLKATNSYWNPFYYRKLRPTLSKKLIYSTFDDLQNEIRTLMYLAKVTGRSLIIPNLLGPDHYMKSGIVDGFIGHSLWPYFRVVHTKTGAPILADIVEPAYYWRINKDYISFDNTSIPDPTVILFNKKITIKEIEDKLLSPDIVASPRIVIGYEYGKEAVHDHYAWALDSTGGAKTYDTYAAEKNKYLLLPKIDYHGTDLKDPGLSREMVEYFRPCNGIFEISRGNRSCFDKCK